MVKLRQTPLQEIAQEENRTGVEEATEATKVMTWLRFLITLLSFFTWCWSLLN
jgi:hypothetical protein